MAVGAEDLGQWVGVDHRCRVRQVRTQKVAMPGTHARVVQCERILRSQIESVCSRSSREGQ